MRRRFLRNPRSKSNRANWVVFGRDVELHAHGLDRYGRTLAVIFVNGMDANLEQVRSGVAWVYDRYVVQAGAEIRASCRQAEAEAWEQQRGLWSERDSMPPCELFTTQQGTFQGPADHVVYPYLQPKQECAYQGRPSCSLRLPLLMLPRKLRLPNMRCQRVLAASLTQLV